MQQYDREIVPLRLASSHRDEPRVQILRPPHAVEYHQCQRSFRVRVEDQFSKLTYVRALFSDSPRTGPD